MQYLLLIFISFNLHAQTFCTQNSDCIPGCLKGYEATVCKKAGCMTKCLHRKDAIALAGQNNCQDNEDLNCECVQKICNSKPVGPQTNRKR